MAAANKGRDPATDFEDVIEGIAQEFDPEENDVRSDDSDSSDEEDADQGREHYTTVTKSQLRKPRAVALGPQYQGARITRDALASDEEDDDPFSRGLEVDGNSEDEVNDSVADSVSGESEGLDAVSADETVDTDLSAKEPEIIKAQSRRNDESEVQNQLRQIIASDSRQTTAFTLSQAAKEDAEKGRSVKRQRKTFDSLLSARMKLQKSLIATNTLVTFAVEQMADEQEEARKALEAAEKAAFDFWNSLNSLREDLLESRSSKKRKRTLFSAESSCEDLATHIEAQEAESRQTRNSVLEKWSRKARGPSLHPERGRLNQDRQATVVDILHEQLSNPERLIKKTHAPRSCAPVQVSKGVVEDDEIYDDADFYSLLLKELLEQKSHDSIAASSVDISFQIRRENKTKRNVDTKASKGRKLRYTVQEKLQNLMAPEDRSSWGARQADELFGSLFGRRMGLGEKDDDEEMVSDLHLEEAGLMMFRN